jgi:pyruvate dehydrogenase E2 component (dihydrolipoamide acetyltransferase)
MIHEVFMPALSSTMTEGKIVEWLKSPGDKVERGETVVVVESDKADMDVESFNEGFLASILVPAGESAPVGNTIALLAETEAEIPEAQARGSKGSASPPAAPPATPEPAAPESEPIAENAAGGTAGNRVVVSPRARKLAKTLGVNLETLKGTGPHGRIVTADVEQAAGKVPSAPAATAVSTAIVPSPSTVVAKAPAPSPTPSVAPSQPPTPIVAGQITPFNTLQQAVVRNMMASLQVPTFRVGYTITTDALDALYKQVKSKGVTMTALLAKAVAMTLKKHPVVNASFQPEGIYYNGSINIAIAVAMEDGGLITPVLQNADQTDLYALSRQWKDLVSRSRTKQLKPDEYSTGTFTLSNLGMFGVDRFDAILPPGQGSILAIGAAKPTVIATADGLLGVRRQMQVNMTSDHRIIYGADAAQFLQDLATLIETNPQSLTL